MYLLQLILCLFSIGISLDVINRTVLYLNSTSITFGTHSSRMAFVKLYEQRLHFHQVKT